MKSTRVVDYRILGLPKGECDVARIRASLARAVNSPRTHVDGSDRLVKVTAAGYRLLDPRFRRGLYERIQLTYAFTEVDESSKAPAVSSGRSLLASKLGIASPNDLLGMADDDNLDPSEHLHTDLDDAREIVRLLQSFDDSEASASGIESGWSLSHWIQHAMHVAVCASLKTLAVAFQAGGTWYSNHLGEDESTPAEVRSGKKLS